MTMKLVDIKQFEVGSIGFQIAMEHNIYTRLIAGPDNSDLTEGELVFMEVQIDHLKRNVELKGATFIEEEI
jgi:hypothetical protein